ncbi:MAG: class I SAM-dependent methyltransferase [Candidatus Hydrogenedentes bacterium]|nr:class I SAM-dependent methyltransferase [Candidatus Hydrogenedentota bacterium]
MDNDDIKQHYNRAAEKRDERLKSSTINVSQYNHTLRDRVIRDFLTRSSPYEKGIDMGTGTGVWAEVLTEYCGTVVGVDFAEENIRVATTNAKELGLDSRLSYHVGDAQALEGIADEGYDVAVQISVLQHLPDKKACLTRVHEILKPNGTLVLLVHNRNCIYNHNLRSQQKKGGQVSVNEYTSLPDLLALLGEAGFNVTGQRLNWLFLFDLLFLGINRPFLRPFAPVRRLAMAGLSVIENALGRFSICNPLFREIVILAKKDI